LAVGVPEATMAIPQNALQKLSSFGQSVWLDFIERGFVRGGQLAALILQDGVSGVTSNPAIFQKAIGESAVYREAIDAMARQGLAAHEIQEALIIEDIRDAADVLCGVFQRTQGRDGFVSLEVSPRFAHDTEGTYWEAKRLWTLVSRPNLMIKVPGTAAGVPAIRRLIAEGINVNVTLLFTLDRYAAVADAFLEGLSELAARQSSVADVASVASFFLSRIDGAIDPKLDAAGTAAAKALRGECAIACARAAYGHYQSIIAGSRWRALQERGARPQRLPWASTGAKDPAYSDVKYVDALVCRDTVTTLPPETLIAYRDHGRAAPWLPERPEDPQLSMQKLATELANAGIDWQAVALQLETDGVRKFVQPHEATLSALRERIAALRA
jgi:transaldolase